MAKLKGVGAPTRRTAGAIGDIYTDSKTGQEYICTFAYKSGIDEEFDCEWKKRVNGKKVEISSTYGEIKKEEKPETPVNDAEVVEESPEKPEAPVTPKRRDYSAYGKKNR